MIRFEFGEELDGEEEEAANVTRGLPIHSVGHVSPFLNYERSGNAALSSAVVLFPSRGNEIINACRPPSASIPMFSAIDRQQESAEL